MMVRAINRRSALGLLAAGSTSALIPTLPPLFPEPDAMFAMCEARRRYLAAYAVADFEGMDGELAWTEANDPDPDNVLGRNPPPITSDDGLRAAIDYVASDVDFAQDDHVRVLKRALEYLDSRRGWA